MRNRAAVRRLNRARLRRHIERARRARIRRKRTRHTSRKGVAPQRVIVGVPKTFDFRAGRDATLRFFEQLLRQLGRRKSVYVDMSEVTHVEESALLSLVAYCERYKRAGVSIMGNYPLDPVTRTRVQGSGFVEAIYEKAFRVREQYSKTGNSFLSHASKVVQSERTAELVEDVARRLWGDARFCPQVQRVLVELMQNTNNHASGNDPGQRHWWLSVHFEEQESAAYFAFVDVGVGVFGSLSAKDPRDFWWAWLLRTRELLLSRANNASVLSLMLDNSLHRTVTGESFRGKGLPALFEVCQRNGVTDLRILTNDVYAAVSEGMYLPITPGFTGTLVSWKVTAANHSVLQSKGT